MFVMTEAIVMNAAVLAVALGTGAGADEKRHASGTFEVKLTPVTGDNGVASGRMSGTKTFAGELTGTSKGDMWTAETAVQGSAGYVAIEKVDGTLNGRRGTFTLLHHGDSHREGDSLLRLRLHDLSAAAIGALPRARFPHSSVERNRGGSSRKFDSFRGRAAICGSGSERSGEPARGRVHVSGTRHRPSDLGMEGGQTPEGAV